MVFLTLMKLPEINLSSSEEKINALPEDTPPLEPQKQEPEAPDAKKTLGKTRREELKRREQEERVKKAIETALAASRRAEQEASQKATPEPMERTSPASAGPARNPPAQIRRTSSASAGIGSDPRVALFGQEAERRRSQLEKKGFKTSPGPSPKTGRRNPSTKPKDRKQQKPRR